MPPQSCVNPSWNCVDNEVVSLPSHTLSLPGSGSAAGLKSVRPGCWAGYKNGYRWSLASPLGVRRIYILCDKGYKLHIDKSQVPNHIHRLSTSFEGAWPKLRTVLWMSSLWMSNAYVLHTLCSFTCLMQVFPEDSRQCRCHYSQANVFRYIWQWSLTH